MDEKYIFNKRKAAKLIKIALCSISEKKKEREKERKGQWKEKERKNRRKIFLTPL